MVKSWIFFFFFAGEGWRSCARTFVLLSYRRKRSKGFALVNMRPGCAIVTGQGQRAPPQPVNDRKFLSESFCQLQLHEKRKKKKKKNRIKIG